MNSSSSNSNNGFSTIHEINPILGFNSPPLSGAGGATSSGSYLSRPRLMKVRKQTYSHNHKFNSPLHTRVAGADGGLGFNQFSSSSESVLGNLSSGNVAKESPLFGANRGNSSSSYLSDRGVSNVNSNAIVDDISKLKINSDQVYANATGNNASFNFKKGVNKSMINELPMEISKPKIEGTSMNPTNNSQFTSFVDSEVSVELQNELNRMSLKDPADNSPGSDNLISDRMRELKVSGDVEASDSSTVFGNDKQNDVSRGKDVGGTKDRIEVSDSASTSFMSSHFQSFGTASSLSRSEKMSEFAFTSKLDDIRAPHVEFKTPSMKSSLFSGLNRFEANKESVKDTRSKKKKGKLKKPMVGSSRLREDFGFTGISFSENPDTFEAYSPMDISPYDEKLADNYSRETSLTSEDASEINDQNHVLGESHIMTSTTEENQLDAVLCTGVSDVDLNPSLARDEVFEPQINEVSETESFKSATDNLEYSSDTFVTALDSDESSTATSGRQEYAATWAFNFASKSDNSSKDSFTFVASSSSQCPLPSGTRQLKKKQIIRDSFSSTSDAKHLFVSSSSAEYFQTLGNSSILFPGEGQKAELSKSLSKKMDNLKPVDAQDFKHEVVTTSSSSKIAEDVCEKWRLRGNQAYNNGDLAKAEDCYTLGLNSVSQNEKSRSCLRALTLCYSNRAATRMSLGRMKEALGDCLMATTIDPDFLKVQVRAAHCYLVIGELENAKQQYMKCLQSRNDNSMDRKVIAEASEGLEKTQKVSDCIKQCTDLFQRRASEDLECALRAISEALQISSYSEKLLQMKADALFMLQRYEQVIQMCEKKLTSDEVDTSTSTCSSSNLWRSHLIVKSYFYLGRLEDALDYIKKLEKSGHATERLGNTSQKSGLPLADTIRELISHKTAGNEAYKSGKHAEAIEHYTAALSCNIESRPFAAICFCNRAAAYRSLGQITDAIADCSLAIALDPNYHKAISRRASLTEMIRDYGQAAIDLQRLVSLLTIQEEKDVLSGASDKFMHELKQTQLQLSNVEEESRKGIPLNLYLILGVESTASASDIKKAYRKAALRHHPDKASQSLGRSYDGDEPLWKEITENIHKDADRLFKLIGEAYAVLSNPSKRTQYDQDEEMRNEVNRFTSPAV